jgi:hypothetical protein
MKVVLSAVLAFTLVGVHGEKEGTAIYRVSGKLVLSSQANWLASSLLSRHNTGHDRILMMRSYGRKDGIQEMPSSSPMDIVINHPLRISPFCPLLYPDLHHRTQSAQAATSFTGTFKAPARCLPASPRQLTRPALTRKTPFDNEMNQLSVDIPQETVAVNTPPVAVCKSSTKEAGPICSTCFGVIDVNSNDPYTCPTGRIRSGNCLSQLSW